jgi:hypothetical protein
MTAKTAVHFDIGVCHLWPGEKLPDGDPRWRQHTRSFVKEEHTVESLAEAIAADGCAISAVMRGDYRVGTNFVSAQHLGLDYDTGTLESSIDMLMEHAFFRDYAAIIHETVSSTPAAPRSRVVFVLDRPISDPQEHRLAAEALLHKFGTADEQCRDEARFFYGRKNARYEVLGNILYRDVLYEQVIEPYQRVKAGTNGHQLAGPVPGTIPVKYRNTTLTSLAGTMRRRGMGEDAIYAALQAENTARCIPPLDDEEIRIIAHSVSRYEPASGFHALNEHPQEEPDAEEVQLHITPLANVVSEKVYPLWDKRIFQGKLAVMAGDPGVGKSYASLDIAARVSLGGPWPDGVGHAPQGNVLLLSAEDGLADTVKPRLELLGADMRRIHALGLTVSKGAEELGLSLQQHLAKIEQLIVENDIILMVVDPLLAFTGKTDTHKSAETRALLSPMAAMAERTGCAILAVMHPNKNSSEGNLLYRISASLDFTAAARSVMVVAKHPDNPDQRVLATIKCNLTAHPGPMAFGFTHDGHFTWQGIADVDVSRLMAPPVRDEDRNEREEAKDFLKTLLADGPVPATQVHQESKQLNISSRTLTRAKADLGIVSLCSGTGVEGRGKGRGKTATWHWRLPEHLPGTFKLATPPASTSGQLKHLEPKEHHADTEQGDIFKLATGNVKSGLEGGNVKNPSPSTESSMNPPQSFKLANPEVQDVANLKDGDNQERDSLEF